MTNTIFFQQSLSHAVFMHITNDKCMDLFNEVICYDLYHPVNKVAV